MSKRKKKNISNTSSPAGFKERTSPAKWKQWGTELDPKAIEQMLNACRLPIAVSGALMPDAHLGYGLPIGGVLATENAVIPYAVGVDIACRMKMSILDIPLESLHKEPYRQNMINALLRQTRFGIGAEFETHRYHKVMDEDWGFCKEVKQLKDKAWSQLGTSGSGNHFAEYGTLTVLHEIKELKPGKYLALLTHSGSRAAGNILATHFSKLAKDKHRDLPAELSHLAWLGMDTEQGQLYWRTMELMGRYASANHQLIHHHIANDLGVDIICDIENHHNFAWKEQIGKKNVIVHRKGATPAGKNDIGIIPGSMATPGFVVRGLQNPESLNSASHGAGRKMSRKKAKKMLNWAAVMDMLNQKNITLLSAGLDEAPMAYKDIETVMSQQKDLVKICAKFEPAIVKMAPGNERAED